MYKPNLTKPILTQIEEFGKSIDQTKKKKKMKKSKKEKEDD